MTTPKVDEQPVTKKQTEPEVVAEGKPPEPTVISATTGNEERPSSSDVVELVDIDVGSGKSGDAQLHDLDVPEPFQTDYETHDDEDKCEGT